MVAGLCAAPAALAEPGHIGWPNSIDAIGDSSLTGFNSNPILPGRDARQNSWSTGDNPEVKSHYLRILAANPKIKGHAQDAAHDGAGVGDLAVQARSIAADHPDYVTVQIGGNDFCGPGELSVATFTAQFTAGLRALSAAAPNARILVVGLQAFSPAFVKEIGRDPGARDAYSRGPCAPGFDANGVADPAKVAQVDAKVQSHNRALAAGCALFIHCRYDGASIDKLPFALADLSSDFGHQSVQGLTKQAEATWSATFDFTDAVAPVSKARRVGRRVTLTATDGVGVAGLEYRLKTAGPWTRYARPVLMPKGTTLTWRAVDVNGNCEASHSLRIP